MKTQMLIRSAAAVFASAAAVVAVPAAAGAVPTVPIDPANVIDVAALPLSDTAHWLPIMGNERQTDMLIALQVCSPNGVPDPSLVDHRAAAASPVFVAPLVPGENADTQGWTGTVSAAWYNNVNEASFALDAYRTYLDRCPLATVDSVVNSAVGTSVLDPTMAHALIGTFDHWIETFAVATHEGLVEVAFVRPKDGPVTFAYDPARVFAAIKQADLGALARPNAPR